MATREDKSPDFKRRKELETELLWLPDPLKLAENTIGLLRKDDDEKALELIRMASKRSQCTVSWNHVIDYEMSKERVQKAERIYNEMKKRAQLPDAHTYTILLRGLAWHPHIKESLPRALKIYHSMFAQNCPVQPNIIHTNAVIKVCALAKDMDALWGVAAKLPSRGPGAPDNFTYTTILNAIRMIAWHADKDLPDEGPVEKSLRRQRAVLQGRRLWEDIIPRWRGGDFRIDEELVCAMGRLLLLGSTERDHNDILSLVEQVMGIPRQYRRPPGLEQIVDTRENSSTNSIPVDPEESSASSIAQLDDIPIEGDENASATADEEEASSEPQSERFPEMTPALANVFQHQSTSKKASISTALPGRNTLSLILDACIHLRAVRPAQAYWGLLTDPSGTYNVKPDNENYHMYLRLLRVQRASKTAVALLKDMHSGDLQSMKILEPKTFRIAMSVCVRDKLNAFVLSHAQTVLETMYKSLETPDVKTCAMYIELVGETARRDFHTSVAALRKLETGMLMLKHWVVHGMHGVGDVDDFAIYELARNVVGVCDSIRGVAGDRLEGEEKIWLMELKMGWSAWVQRRGRRDEEVVENRRRAREIEDEELRTGVRKARSGPPEVRKVDSARRVKPHQRGSKVGFRRSRSTEGGMRKRMERGRNEMRRHGEFDFYDDQ